MSRDPYAPPASEEEQLSEVARILGVALHRWHRLNRGKGINRDPPLDAAPASLKRTPIPRQQTCLHADTDGSGLSTSTR